MWDALWMGHTSHCGFFCSSMSALSVDLLQVPVGSVRVLCHAHLKNAALPPYSVSSLVIQSVLHYSRAKRELVVKKAAGLQQYAALNRRSPDTGPNVQPKALLIA